MRVTEEELIGIWKYFQYCCLPAIVMARYAYFDYLPHIKEEKMFYRHETKQAINKIGKYLDVLPNRLMDVNSQNVNYMNILSDNVDELFEDEKEELHKAIYLSFKNAKWKHVDCFAALHFISAMLQISVATFTQCCIDLQKAIHKDPTDVFHSYNLQETTDKWDEIVDKATEFFDKDNKKALDVELNNIRCIKAIDEIRKKLSDIETLRTAMRKSYPWSPNYRKGIPYELSADYIIVNNQNQEEC